jgi:hypothetical protein
LIGVRPLLLVAHRFSAELLAKEGAMLADVMKREYKAIVDAGVTDSAEPRHVCTRSPRAIATDRLPGRSVACASEAFSALFQVE